MDFKILTDTLLSHKRFIFSIALSTLGCLALALSVHQSDWRKGSQSNVFSQTQNYLSLPEHPNYPAPKIASIDGVRTLEQTLFDERFFNSIPPAIYEDLAFRSALFAQGFLGQTNALIFPWIYSGRYNEYTVPLQWEPSFLTASALSLTLLMALWVFILRRAPEFTLSASVALLSIGSSFCMNPAALLLAYTSTADLFSDRFMTPGIPFFSFFLLIFTLVLIHTSAREPHPLAPMDAPSDPSYPAPSISNTQLHQNYLKDPLLRRALICLFGILTLHSLIFFPHLFAWRSDFTRAHYYALNSPKAIAPANHLSTQYQSKGSYPDALEWAQKASTNSAHTWPITRARSELLRAKLLYLTNDVDEALTLTQQVSPILESSHLYHELAEHYAFLGQVALDHNDSKGAFNALNDALTQLYKMRAHYGGAIAWQQFYYLNVRLALHAQRPDIAWSSYVQTQRFERSFLLAHSSYNKEHLERRFCSEFIHNLDQTPINPEAFTPDVRFVFAKKPSNSDVLALLKYAQTCTTLSQDAQPQYPAVRFTKSAQ